MEKSMNPKLLKAAFILVAIVIFLVIAFYLENCGDGLLKTLNSLFN
jgi:hypothetical protein